MPVPVPEKLNVRRVMRDGNATAMSARGVWLGIQDSNLD